MASESKPDIVRTGNGDPSVCTGLSGSDRLFPTERGMEQRSVDRDPDGMFVCFSYVVQPG